MSGAPRPLTATYRLQLHKDFGLEKVREIVPYLHLLGISHVYSSPVLMARPGSTHGYDVVDPTRLDPELGTGEHWRAVISELHGRGMGWVLDIVPNHMGTGSANPFWENVLARGRESPYARWFDIDWEAGNGKIVLPVLGDELDAVLERGELSLVRQDGKYRVRYFENSFPVTAGNREWGVGNREGSEGWTRAEIAMLASVQPQTSSPIPHSQFPSPGPDLRAVLAAQHYRLTFWRRAWKEINYRRFFDINDLVALRTEDPAVFAETHRLVLRWVREGVLDGLRIDHIDGLLDPRGYLEALRKAIGETPAGAREPRFPIFVEKILSPGEHLRREWPVEGTTGYEFMNDLERIFIDPRGAAEVETLYRRVARITRPELDFGEVAIRGKLLVLRTSLEADVRRLAGLLGATAREAREAIVQLIACLPVYRTYLDPHTLVPDESDREVLARALACARERTAAHPGALDALEDALLGGARARQRDELARPSFAARVQQTSGPATAKGVEDMALYRYVPLISLNEVGGDPGRPLEEAVGALHRGNAERAGAWPRALLATNTHDTKRSADVRARVDVLSEMPAEWARQVARWRRLNRPHRTRLRGRLAPDASTEYLLYQTLVGMWPLLVSATAPTDDLVAKGYYRVVGLPERDTMETLRERVSAYMLKAAREAKAHTSWTDPNEEWEQALTRFIHGILSDAENAEHGMRREAPASRVPRSRRSRSFVSAITSFTFRIARPGMWNALARVLIHLGAPGTPDLYQGDELWSFALVDPDNRRPVDYALRRRLLEEVGQRFATGGSERERLVREMVEAPQDGRVKLHVTHRALRARQEHPELFTRGDYLPLHAHGPAAIHVFAFARLTDHDAALIVAPRLTLTLLGDSSIASETDGESDAAMTDRPLSLLIPPDVWRETFLVLPAELGGLEWKCQLTGQRWLLDAPQHVAAEQQGGAHPQPRKEVNPALDDSTGASRRGTAVAYASASQLSLEHVLRAMPAALLHARRPDV
ncbi:MAG: malto-oligosyltrehalose synthase [Gemmatimonadaceae bacterium]